MPVQAIPVPRFHSLAPHTNLTPKAFLAIPYRCFKRHTQYNPAGIVILIMKIRLLFIIILALSDLHSQAQTRTVENRPYTDLRPFHFGVLVGTHFQDIEFQNIGQQTITGTEGTTTEQLITCDQDRWDAGFTVGVLGELRIDKHFAFRVAPAMYFGNRHLTFHHLADPQNNGTPTEQHQDMKTAYISSALHLIYGAERLNNYRPYIIAGLNPMINLSGSSDNYLKLKRYDCYFEIGIGCDFYLPFFKLRPELKFSYSLMDALDKTHSSRLKDKNMLAYSNSVNKAHTKIIALTFYFE